MKDIDTELRVRLLSAKRKPHYFALICSGSKCLKLLLDKRRIPPGTAQSAKREVKGQRIYSGTCQGSKGADMVFEVIKELPTVPVATFRKFLVDAAGVTLAPRFVLLEKKG
jgi:hypothetical protein